MHLAATNLALWTRLVIWESGMEWTYFVHLAQSAGVVARTSSYDSGIPTPLQLKGYPKSFTEHIRHKRDLGFGKFENEVRFLSLVIFSNQYVAKHIDIDKIYFMLVYTNIS